ncbi:hypothetical protein D3C74_405450 [compost metagenome]
MDQQNVRIIGPAMCVQKGETAFVFLFIEIMIEIVLRILWILHDRVLNSGAVNLQPADDVRVPLIKLSKFGKHNRLIRLIEQKGGECIPTAFV